MMKTLQKVLRATLEPFQVQPCPNLAHDILRGCIRVDEDSVRGRFERQQLAIEHLRFHVVSVPLEQALRKEIPVSLQIDKVHLLVDLQNVAV